MACRETETGGIAWRDGESRMPKPHPAAVRAAGAIYEYDPEPENGRENAAERITDEYEPLAKAARDILEPGNVEDRARRELSLRAALKEVVDGQ